MKIGKCSVCGKEDNLGIDDRCQDCLKDKKAKVFVCCDCGIWSEERPEKCGVCGGQCFTEEIFEDLEGEDAD